jgi:hypothetical protein
LLTTVLSTDVTQKSISSRLPRRAPELSAELARQGRCMDATHYQRAKDGPSGNPVESEERKESSGNRVAFSLVTFFWRGKRKSLAFGCENPIQIIVVLAIFQIEEVKIRLTV